MQPLRNVDDGSVEVDEGTLAVLGFQTRGQEVDAVTRFVKQSVEQYGDACKPGDSPVAVLFRGKKSMALYEDQLSQVTLRDGRPLRVRAVGLSAMLDRPEVQDVLALLKERGVLDRFDGGVASCEVHVNKPAPRIYQALLDQYGLKASECVFIDDLSLNVEGAIHAGMPGLVFRGVERLRGELAAMGVALEARFAAAPLQQEKRQPGIARLPLFRILRRSDADQLIAARAMANLLRMRKAALPFGLRRAGDDAVVPVH